MSDFITDAYGAELKLGDTIVYPVRRGSSMWLQKATVTGFVPEKNWRGVEEPRIQAEYETTVSELTSWGRTTKFVTRKVNLSALKNVIKYNP